MDFKHKQTAHHINDVYKINEIETQTYFNHESAKANMIYIFMNAPEMEHIHHVIL